MGNDAPWFEDLGRDDIPVTGGIEANLREMTRAGMSVGPELIDLSGVRLHTS